MLDERLKPGLMWRARAVMEREGIEGLIRYRHHASACGCMGPQDGEPLCGCAMWGALERNLLGVVSEIDEAAALKLMRCRIIAALSGG